MKKIKKYTLEFKESAVSLIRDGGRTATAVAAELGIDRSNLSRWVRESAEAHSGNLKAFPGHGNPRDEELTRLRKENADLRETNEILKKAMAIFAVRRPQ